MKGIDWLDVCLEIFSDYTARERFDKPNSIIFAELHQHIDIVVDIAINETNKNVAAYEKIEQLLYWSGICGLKMGKYHYALEQLLRAYDIKCRSIKKEKKYCDICRGISQAYNDLGMFEESRHWLLEANVDKIAYHADLGAIYYNEKRWNDAWEEYATAFSLCNSDEQRGIIANHIALIHLIGKGDWYSAWQYFQPALPLLKDENIEDEIKAKLFNTLAGIKTEEGNFDLALQIYETLLVMRKKIYNGSHPDVARVYQNIGGVYDKKGNREMTLKSWETAAKMYIEVSGKDNVYTRGCVANIYYYLLVNGTEQELESIMGRLGYRD